VADALAHRERDEAVALLVAAGVPASPVLAAADAARLDHFVARGVTGLDAAGRTTVGHPVRFARHSPTDDGATD
jgi:crotonobetainyl-CoA:carnitine CoA-transferase CaiB-like acyl-CoA transferase